MTSLSSSSSDSNHQTRILVVDDEPNLLDAIARYLRRRGYEVETAKDGLEGLEKLERTAHDAAGSFNLLITDINMPNLGGVELIHAIRTRKLPLRVIACSSAFTNETLNELEKLSVEATLPKFSLAEKLLEVVDRVVRQRG